MILTAWYSQQAYAPRNSVGKSRCKWKWWIFCLLVTVITLPWGTDWDELTQQLKVRKKKYVAAIYRTTVKIFENSFTQALPLLQIIRKHLPMSLILACYGTICQPAIVDHANKLNVNYLHDAWGTHCTVTLRWLHAISLGCSCFRS